MAARKDFISRVIGWAARKKGLSVVTDPTRTPAQPQSSLNPLNQFRLLGIRLFSWGDWDAKQYVQEGYMGNAGLYSIINRITRTAAISPFKVYRIKDKQKHLRIKGWTGPGATEASLQKAIILKNLAYEEDSSHPFNKLLEKPNDWQNMNEFVQTCIGFKLITGNRFLFINEITAGANKGRPFGIYNLPPQHMAIIAGETMWQVVGYELQLGTIVRIPVELIVHSRYWNPYYDLAGSHLFGLSPLKAASKTLERSNKAEQRGATMLDNAGAAGVMFDKSGYFKDLSQEQADEMKQKINDEVLGIDNAGKIAMANGDLGYLNFGQTGVEMQIIEQEKYSDEKLCNIYGVPAGLFMANANATDNNIKAWNKQLITGPVLQALCELREDLNKIAARYGEDIWIDFDPNVYPELQEDLEKTAKVMQMSHWLNGNEKRIATGHDEDTANPMMKAYLVPNNLTDISNLDPNSLRNELDREDDSGTGEDGTSGGSADVQE